MKFIFLLIVIGLSIGVFFMYVKPRYDSIQATKNQVSAYNTSLQTADQLKASREQLIAKYNTISKTDLDGIKALLPDSVDNIRLIIQINALATKNGLSTLRTVDYQTVDVSAPSANSPQQQDPAQARLPYGKFTISFETAGQYSNFLAFLSDLEQNLRLVDVTDIVFDTGSTGAAGTTTTTQTAANSINYKVKLNTYWLKQ